MSDLFANYIKSNSVSFKYAKGQSELSGKEFHLFHEIILFLGGNAELVSETIHTKIKPKTLIVIPKETYHQLIISGDPDAYWRCIFQFRENGQNAGLINAGLNKLFVTECDKQIYYLFSRLMKISEKNEDGISPYISEATLILLLDEIRNKKDDETYPDYTDNLTKQAIEFINANLTDDLSINVIARNLSVSESTLMHKFKNSMNISIHKYVMKKRLILAHSRISGGESAGTVATECGFNDYSGFYKQYKMMFNASPSSKNEK